MCVLFKKKQVFLCHVMGIILSQKYSILCLKLKFPQKQLGVLLSMNFEGLATK